MSGWSRGLVYGVFVVLVMAGLGLVHPISSEPDRKSDLGAAIVSGIIVSAAVLFVQWRQSVETDKRNLQIMVSLQDRLRGADFSNRDLAGFHLAGKDFTGANFVGADLRQANLSGATLEFAKLHRADLRGAKLDETPLFPSETLYPSETLTPGPILPNANLQGVQLTQAKYDSDTRWPPNITPESAGAIFVDKPWYKLWK